ncbi:DNA/RNA helicase, superfamily II [Fervidobacterium pennivorans DSM 9078]|jgi:ATP-dependent RNA helicase DeaD|uniref:DNA/RNA helicase, superfamily II n=1 Tax=Fervidobacterium pennivorans (strain DSM 9078 / Ven5) TaxID=771875 RepID=H9UBY0_FERPD|nr:DEAD/DEAH box helicase [Fervidobacterium pennivorans]AFG35023.1 DNA/RNA helicase, superfamily II [Fervidobacterium pennivorans DSM 9078]QIV78085.1 DEAD/DEAH box helicase [Fervidobacterium pennivorans subsp. keratinolyticus]
MKNTDITKSVERGSGFEVFGLSKETLSAIEKKGYTQPTEIQKLVLPVALETDKDIIAQAQTGTGKTAAFAIPILELVDFKVDKSIKALIVTPTRELALQIYEEIKSLKGNRRIKVATVYGGQSMERQLKDLARGIDIVVGTPGRLLDHINRKTLDLSNVKYLVLDEADRMLDMGFLDDVLEIIKQTPETKRTFLFSATMPKEIVSIARKFMKDYEHISTVKEELTTENAEQLYFEIEEDDKLPLLCRIIDMNPEFYGIVFCQTKAEVDEIARKLSDLGYNADGLHGDYSQSQRERVLDKFKKKQLNILVTTDVAARGIDIEGLTHVINYSVPRDPEYYVHRIGRTGRAGKKGLAITFVTRSDYYHFTRVKRFTKAKIAKDKIPMVEDILNRQLENVVNTIKKESYVSNELFRQVAQKLIEEMGPTEAVEMLLHTLLKEKIDVTRYGNIKLKDFSKQSENNSTVRLFVALGSSKGLDKKRLVEYISERTGIEPKNINNVRVFETYSFIDVNEADADVIMRTLNKNTGKSGRYSKSSKPLVQKAREKKVN